MSLIERAALALVPSCRPLHEPRQNMWSCMCTVKRTWHNSSVLKATRRRTLFMDGVARLIETDGNWAWFYRKPNKEKQSPLLGVGGVTIHVPYIAMMHCYKISCFQPIIIKLGHVIWKSKLYYSMWHMIRRREADREEDRNPERAQLSVPPNIQSLLFLS